MEELSLIKLVINVLGQLYKNATSSSLSTAVVPDNPVVTAALACQSSEVPVHQVPEEAEKFHHELPPRQPCMKCHHCIKLQ